MKPILSILVSCLFTISGMAQSKPRDKPPTQKEMEAMMKEARKMVNELSEEDKKIMDSLGVKMPGFTNAPNVSDKQLSRAWENENRIVPKRDAARIAAITKGVTDARMESYIAAIQKKLMAVYDERILKVGDKAFAYIQSNSKNGGEAGNMAAAFWLIGKPQLALYVLGKVCTETPGNTDNLSNYAAMLSMQGAEHLAIPILNNLNKKFPNNSTLLNNLGQAWLGLGELLKAEEYINKTLVLCPLHPQANMAKAAIAESKGKVKEAREAVKKSLQHSYTTEKEEKLTKLGEKLSHTLYVLPPRKKNDLLNLGGFRSPFFPMTSLGCIGAEVEWNIFYKQIDEKIQSLYKLRKDAEDAVVKGNQKRLDENAAYIKAAQANPGKPGQRLAIPLFAMKATKKLAGTMSLMQRKMEAYNHRLGLYTQEYLQLKKDYEKEMNKLRREDEAQTGDHRENEAYCPKYGAVTDKYLKDINNKLQELYLEALTLKKEMLNESAYFALYMMWPDEFQVAKYDYQIEWLNFLKKGFGVPANGSGFPFVLITLKEYSCNDLAEKEEPELTNLQKFDDIHCEYHSKMDLKIIKFTTDCSRMTSELDLNFFEYTRNDDFEQAEGDTYVSSTIKISAEMGVGDKIEKGPLKAEAKAGAGIVIEIDRKGVKDVNLTAEAKAGIGTNVFDEGLEKHGSIAGKDIVNTTIEVGIEGRISIMSGQGTITGTGILDGVTITEF